MGLKSSSSHLIHTLPSFSLAQNRSLHITSIQSPPSIRLHRGQPLLPAASRICLQHRRSHAAVSIGATVIGRTQPPHRLMGSRPIADVRPIKVPLPSSAKHSATAAANVVTQQELLLSLNFELLTTIAAVTYADSPPFLSLFSVSSPLSLILQPLAAPPPPPLPPRSFISALLSKCCRRLRCRVSRCCCSRSRQPLSAISYFSPNFVSPHSLFLSLM